MDGFLTKLYQEYFAAVAHLDELLALRNIPATEKIVINERIFAAKQGKTAAEHRITSYMRASYVEKNRLPSG